MSESQKLLESIKRDYVISYAYGICEALRSINPDLFNKEFGSIENCVKAVQDDAELWFEKWKKNWAIGVISRVKG